MFSGTLKRAKARSRQAVESVSDFLFSFYGSGLRASGVQAFPKRSERISSWREGAELRWDFAFGQFSGNAESRVCIKLLPQWSCHGSL